MGEAHDASLLAMPIKYAVMERKSSRMKKLFKGGYINEYV